VSEAARADALLACPSLAPEVILARAQGENFSVALRWLPERVRDDLTALYGFARLVDQIGDEAPGDRWLLLDEVERDLARAFDGEPRHPLLRRLAPTIARHALPRAPFARLIEANRLDQRLARIATWEELLQYCALSANPVGELVLGVFDCADESRVRRSGAVCTALQVIEHCQDVAEDFARGRVYLPAKDLAAAGCRDEDLVSAPASEALRAAVALQIERARGLLAEARPLVAGLRGFARIAVAGYAAGGLATCDAFAGARFDPNARPVRARRRARLRHALALWARGAASPSARAAAA
jgi:phytoene synthase